jgi:hypothetical protein
MGNVLGQDRLNIDDGSFCQQLVLHKEQRPCPGSLNRNKTKLTLWLSLFME